VPSRAEEEGGGDSVLGPKLRTDSERGEQGKEADTQQESLATWLTPLPACRPACSTWATANGVQECELKKKEEGSGTS